MNTYLLDTHIALWIFSGDKRLPEDQFFERFGDSNFIFHQVSTWEIQIKYQLKKLHLPKPPKDYLPNLIQESAMYYRHIEDEAIFHLDKLPEFHKDPFDRLLIAHAMVNGWTLISSNNKFTEYPVLLEKI